MYRILGLFSGHTGEEARFATAAVAWLSSITTKEALLENTTTLEFYDEFIDLFDAAPTDVAAGEWGSLSLSVLVQTIETANSTEPKTVAEVLRDIHVDTLFGEVAFDENSKQSFPLQTGWKENATDRSIGTHCSRKTSSHTLNPNYQEDESMHRETLENLDSSPFPKKHVRIELTKEAREGPNALNRAERLMAPPPRGRDCSPSAEKHVNIVLATRGLREPEHSRQSRAFCVEQRTESYSGPDRGRIHSPASGGIP